MSVIKFHGIQFINIKSKLHVIRARLFEESFLPGLLGVFINPFYLGRKEMFKQLQKVSPIFTGKILDIGCGRKPYERLFSCDRYIGMDMEKSGHQHINSKIDIFYDGHTFPFDSNQFDGVIMTEVLEHIFNPNEILLEINRVLKMQGLLLITTPFLWIEHEEPYDYARYTIFALESILKKHGFKIIYQNKTLNDLRCIVQLFSTYVFNKCLNINLWIRTIITLLFISPLTILAILIYRFFPKSSNMYLNNIILAEKIN